MKYKMEKLKDRCTLINGYAFKGKDFTYNGVPVIKIANVKPNKIVLDNLQYVPEDVAKKAEKSRIFKNDILLTMSGNRVEGTPDTWVGKACIFRETGYYVLNQRVCIVRPNLNVFDSTYLSYVLSSWNSQLYFIQRATSSGGQANISPAIIRDMEVPCPSIEIQKRIAYILNILDEKIRINEAINDNLAQQAQAIYRNTFVTNANTSWQLGHLSDLITVRYGKDHKKLADGIYPVYGSGGIMRYVEKPLYDKESVLIPRKGTLNNVMYINEPFWSVDTMFYTEMNLPNIAKFVFHFVKSKDLASLNAGSAVPSMTTDILNAMELYIPDTDTLANFESIVAPMYQIMQQNTQECRKLAELRDSLLPRLMSGEIDVSSLNL